MQQYDPEEAPNPAEWLALDEQIRIDLVAQYHRAARVRLPHLNGHAVFHVIVENQLALGEAAVIATLARLIGEGLSRHDAVHAIGSVLAEHVHDLFRDKMTEASFSTHYSAALAELTAARWRRG